MLTVFVEDLLLAGPKGDHKYLWDKLSKLVDIDEVTPLRRFLGRHHELTRSPGGGTVHFKMFNYACQSVEMYQKLNGVTKLRSASRPFCPEGSLNFVDDDVRGEVAQHACPLVMKICGSPDLPGLI
jgi:hypothetical protein